MPTDSEPQVAAPPAAPKLAEAAPAVAEVKTPPQPASPAAGVAATLPRARKIVDNTAAQGARQTMEMTMDQANKAAENMFKAAEEVAEFGRGNVEAFTKATQVYFAGVQDLGRHTVTMMQGLTDHALEGAKALATVKSLQEAAQVQSTYTRGAVEKVVAESAKFQEAALKLAEQSFAPLSARMTVAVEKFSRPLAA
jgi:phasin family protein